MIMTMRLCFALLLTLTFSGCAERKHATVSPRSPAPPSAAKVPAPKIPGPEEPLLLSPAIAAEHKDKMEGEVTARIRRTEQLVAKIDPGRLTTQQSETFSTIQTFLSKAKEALQQKDIPRALNLAEKAQALAQDLPNSPAK